MNISSIYTNEFCYSNYMKKIITAAEIEVRTKEIAEEVIEDYKDLDPHFISLLRGAVPFSNDLMEAIAELDPTFNPSMSYMQTSTYTEAGVRGETTITLDASEELVRDRNIIVVDELLDTGQTTDVVFKSLYNLGAKAVKLIVLIQKEVDRTEHVPKADIYGFPAPNVWLVGKGMNGNKNDPNPEAGRWLKDIWIA